MLLLAGTTNWASIRFVGLDDGTSTRPHGISHGHKRQFSVRSHAELYKIWIHVVVGWYATVVVRATQGRGVGFVDIHCLNHGLWWHGGIVPAEEIGGRVVVLVKEVCGRVVALVAVL